MSEVENEIPQPSPAGDEIPQPSPAGDENGPPKAPDADRKSLQEINAANAVIYKKRAEVVKGVVEDVLEFMSDLPDGVTKKQVLKAITAAVR